MTDAPKIFHNPRCSKSRQTLELLQQQGVEPEIIRYLETPPTAPQLLQILDMLGCEPRDMMRTKEAEYREQRLDNPELTRDQLVQAMIDTPKLIERPIVLANGKAVIGRPPENVLTIL
ncbi:arsenate reductase (glutaredoxin) [Marinobacter fuscus]|uniref:Arsenate reductase n=1 Tax=Marinobacter fuscus TaxID=2109942 RepID=A0A2T1K591_9GAMM|nr:arsenate reductase (glutaredoxin) [Marinobacter fuscus]PSF05344.1 arsenate reductase (glutaredoxin) [Marinobacter fuscus]